jgi:hypothetical protein
VRIDDGAVAFCGASGVGKSTMAAGFQRHGYPVLADDVTVIDLFAPGGPVVMPSFPRIKLWRNAIDSFGVSTDGLERSRPTIEKFHVRTEESFVITPTRLTAVYHLHETRDGGREGITEVRGLAAIRDTYSNVYRRRIGQSLSSPEALLNAVGRLCESVPIMRLGRERDFLKIGPMVKTVACMHAGMHV